MPWLAERQSHHVGYDTFMSMTENCEIGMVDIKTNQIIFTGKSEEKPAITVPVR